MRVLVKPVLNRYARGVGNLPEMRSEKSESVTTCKLHRSLTVECAQSMGSAH